MDFDFPGRILVGILAIVLVTLFPLQYLAQSYNENFSNYVDEWTQALSNSIRRQGYLDRSMYEEYMTKLSRTGASYDVKLEDIHPVTGEELAHHCTDEEHSHYFSLNKSGTSNELTNLSTRMGKSKPILSRMVKVNKRSVLKSNQNHSTTLDIHRTPINNNSLFAVHTHTSDCYEGHNHTASGCVKGLTCCNNMRLSYRYDHAYGASYHIFYCASCNQDIMHTRWFSGYGDGYFDVYAFRPTREGGFGMRFIVDITYSSLNNYSGSLLAREVYDGINNMTYYERQSLTLQDLYRMFPIINTGQPGDGYYLPYNPNDYYSCGYTTEDTTPICNQVLTSITATHPYQTIKQGQSIISTATARYLDGHTETVNCSVTGFDTNTIGVQNVTLTYSGRVDTAKTWGIKTCTVTVTVEIRAKQCIAGLGHPDYDANLSQCPVCIAISGISASNQTFPYDGNHHELTIGNTTGAIINVAYDIDPTTAGIVWQWNIGPTEPGTYQVHIYVRVYNSLTGTWGDYFVMERYITILAKLSYITVSPSNQTIERYSSPTFTVTAYYEDGRSKAVTGYSISGINTHNIGTQTATISYTEASITKKTTATVKVTGIIKKCPRCGYTYELGPDDIDPGCAKCKSIVESIKVTPEYLEVSKGSPLPITVKATMMDGSSYDVYTWTSNYDPNTLGLQLVTVEYGGFAKTITVWVHEEQVTCPICKNPYPISLPKCPICSAKVVSIRVSPTMVTVYQYDEIHLNVVAQYADGSSSTVTDWSIDRTTSEVGTFTATVTYEGVSATFTLKVISKSAVECPICGRIYEPRENPSGCPICSKIIVGIEAYLKSGSNLVQYGSLPSLSIVLICRDTHREIIEDGYNIENYNPYQMGEQRIKVFYMEFHTFLDIEVVNSLSSITCPNGHVYYRNEDGSDPGCPYCNVSKGTDTVIYYDITYMDEILDKLYTDGIYYFQSGNYLTIHVSKKNKSLLDKMQNMFFKLTLVGRKEDYVYGGEVF